jgi:enamine deaminase RidA (YjgF/YER057c/UK114 family)
VIDRPYSLVRVHDRSGAVYVSGAAGLDGDDRPLLDGPSAVQAAFDHLRSRLETVGLGLDDVLKVDVHLVDMGLRPAVDEVFRERFSAPRPARKVLGVASLPLGALVLVDAVAYRP